VLPSYVDDVLEYAAQANFPATGETGKIYVDKATGKIFRWSGTVYIEISPSPGSTDSVTEGSTNLYFTNARALSATQSSLDAKLTAPSITVTKTANYSAAVSEVVMCNATSGGFTVTMPTGVADKARIIVKKIDSSTNVVTVTTSGSDVFNSVGSGVTSLTLPLMNQAFTAQYQSSTGVWIVINTDIPLTQTDARYLNQNTTGTAANITGTAAIANGGTGQTSAAAAITALTGTQTAGRYLRSDGTNAALAAIDVADVFPSLSGAVWPGGKSGEYIVFGGPQSTITSPTEGRLMLTPYWAPKSFSISRIALQVATAGSTGSVTRIGAYSDDDGIPGTLLFDAGTVDSTTTGAKEITTTQTLPAGRFWLAAVVQGSAATLARLYGTISTSAWNTNAMLMPLGGGLDAVYFAFYKDSVSGALPSPAFSSRTQAANGSTNNGYSFRVRLT